MADLRLPVGAFATSVPRIASTTSLERAARIFAAHDTLVLVVVDDQVLRGLLPASALLGLADGVAAETSVAGFVVASPSVSSTATGAEALRLVANAPHGVLPIVSPEGFYGGAVTIASLLADREPIVEFGPLGGMATPLGVYLTDGVHRAGPSPWGLILTGAGLFTLLAICNAATIPLYAQLENSALHADLAAALVSVVVVLLFLIGMRLLPIAGTHAAEHMVIHALERQERLSREVVRRMPRVHPRCGTNLAAGAMLFGAIYGLPWGPEEVRLTVGLLVTLFFWRSFGAFIQTIFTTRPPTDRQIDGAIASANELIRAHMLRPGYVVTPWHRLWNSGLLLVMAGSTGMVAVIYAIGFIWPDVHLLLR